MPDITVPIAVAPIPEFPQIAPWYECAIERDRLTLRYSDRAVVFQGRAASEFLPTLFDELDGKCTVDEISQVIGPAVRPALDNALSQLAKHGLLVQGPGPGLPENPWRERAATALSEAIANSVNPTDVAQLLSRTHATVIGDGAVASEIARLFIRSGVATVRAVAEDEAVAELDHMDLSTDLQHLVVVAPGGVHAQVLENVNRWSLRSEIPWTQVLPYDGTYAVIGPTFLPTETGCYHCFRLRRRSQLDFLSEQRTVDAAADAGLVHPISTWSGAGQDAAVAGLAVHLILWSILPVAFTVSPLAGRSYTLSWGVSGMSLTEHRLFRVPRCRDCSRVRDLGVPQPWFEVDTVSETSSFLPRHLVDADQKCTCDSACDSADHARKGSFIPVSSLDVKHSEGGA
ncbi:bacteriocin biosynthesis cyclodehydratase domain [Actinomyces bovis]|uniref:Bacteriocin biosynthesis cyclodehydratase domain n=2 Tax=Actinomyces bovis TaxID=1658 RepID=A0ABY1VLA1_9ACTO|nr:bacteriocin biosynthesis cyclodehydratase domain [Actinomyces bovis]VEG54823.1 bacteriocin biosynthesis cyclodehydratase domain [Actinomyces israelii]